MTLSEFESNLKKSKSFEELNKTLKQYLLTLGITTFSFTYYSHYVNSLNKTKYDTCSPSFLAWHEHYLSQHYEEIDSTMESVYRNMLPIYWDIQDQLKEAKSEREKEMRLDSIKFGSEKGLCIPIHGHDEDFATFLVVQMRGESCLEDWQKLQYSLFVVGYYYCSYVHEMLLKNQKPSPKFALSQREIQCLTLLQKNYSLAAIAKALNITERTVNYHIQRLNKKLGAKNKYQSVAKALRFGLIKL